MKWTLVNPTGTNDPDTGDIYSGLDRFGRVKDNRWLDGAGTDLDRIQYGYDRAGNRIWRKNVVAAALGQEFDELYAYDGVHRLQDMVCGTLNAGQTALTSETFAQCWTLDSTGNWHGFREDDDGDGTWNLIQARTANRVNELTDISETSGPSWVTPAYSPAGNMTTLPQPADPTQSYTATYDAWNRLTQVSAGANTVAAYQYDGAKRRIVQQSYTAGVLSETRHLYYTQPSQWQVLEERLGTSPDSADAERQFVWGLRYIDDCLLRDRDTDANGTLDERLYACQDANWNVTAVVDDAEAVQECYEFALYGTLIVLSPSFQIRTNSYCDWELGFGGYSFSSATSLYYVRFRVLSSDVGWLQRDPLKNMDPLSTYAYVGASPVSAVDPLGLVDEMSLNDFMTHWEYDLYPLSRWNRWRPQFYQNTAAGCIGVATTMLGYPAQSGNDISGWRARPNTSPNLGNCYRSQARARARIDEMRHDGSCCPLGQESNIYGTQREPRLIAIAWNDGHPSPPYGVDGREVILTEDPGGRIDMNNHSVPLSTGPGGGYFNFDFFYLRPDTDTWYHADHSNRRGDPMRCFLRTEDEFEMLWNDYQQWRRFNEFMFCAVCQASWTNEMTNYGPRS